jgi:hypothetical protein
MPRTALARFVVSSLATCFALRWFSPCLALALTRRLQPPSITSHPLPLPISFPAPSLDSRASERARGHDGSQVQVRALWVPHVVPCTRVMTMQHARAARFCPVAHWLWLAPFVCRLVIGPRLVFIESICNDEKMIASNVREVKLKSPDYQHEDEAFAVADFLRRIEQYKVRARCVCVCVCGCSSSTLRRWDCRPFQERIEWFAVPPTPVPQATYETVDDSGEWVTSSSSLLTAVLLLLWPTAAVTCVRIVCMLCMLCMLCVLCVLCVCCACVVHVVHIVRVVHVVCGSPCCRGRVVCEAD